MPLLGALYPQSRVICCVRNVAWIIDSIELIIRKNPLQVSRIFNCNAGGSVYSRVEMLMNSENGLIGLAWSSLREAWFSNDAKRLIIIDYDKLTSDPEAILPRLYMELGEPSFKHDFDHVAYDEPDYDLLLGTPGMHTVREKVEFCKREPCIPPDLFTKYSTLDFWRQRELNRHGATVL